MAPLAELRYDPLGCGEVMVCQSPHEYKSTYYGKAPSIEYKTSR